MTRPYFKHSGADLKKLYDSSYDDLETLLDLQGELKHRKRPKMVKLKEEVEARIGELRQSTPQEKPQPLTPAIPSTPKESPKIPTPTQSTPSGGNKRPTEQKKQDAPKENQDSTRDSAQESHNLEDDEIITEISKIRCSGDLKGTPSKFVFDPKNDVELDVDDTAPIPRKYESAIRLLIAELRMKGAGTQQLTLEKGQRIKVDGGDPGYQFPFEGEVDLFEGAKVQLIIQGRVSEGQIVAVFGKKIILTVNEDLGESIPHCILKVDNTAMLEALQSRLKEIIAGEFSGFNKDISEATLTNSGEEKVPAILPEVFTRSLNERQTEATNKLITNDIFYLWGPPGTGKTQTLSVAVEALLELNKRILLCSNTNQAVDQVLLKICNKFGRDHRLLKDGSVVRIGKISHPELENEWHSYVNLDGIIERKSSDLNNKKRLLEIELEKINKKSEHTINIANYFDKLDSLINQKSQLEQSINKINKSIDKQNKRNSTLQTKLSNLNLEKGKVASATLTRFFRRSIDDINTDINNVTKELEESKSTSENHERHRNEHLNNRNTLQTQIDSLNRKLANYDRTKITSEINELEKQKHPIKEQISSINKELEDISKSIVTNAKVLGATVTKSFISPKLFGNIDVVIIDEASMVMLPALYYASGLAKEKVIISGDFLQLSPIVQSNQKAIIDCIGSNIFHASGITAAFQNNEKLKRVVMLNEQYRMDDRICRLISDKMYNSELITSSSRNNTQYHPPKPFNQSLIVIDSSTIHPFSNKDLFKSRYNLMHALAIRNLSKHLIESGYTEKSTIGVCTPYAAQSKLLSKILKGSALSNIDAGTVHRYQGDEKDVLIFDIPDSIGERFAGYFLQADTPEDDGAKLLNVAISRAKNHVIIIANLSFLDQKLPNHALLRDILCDIQNKGTTLDIRDILGLWPIVDDLKKYGSTLNLNLEAEKTGLFNQKEFNIVSQKDILSARKSIAFFSGFITEQRIATYEPLLRNKLAEGVKIRCVTRPPDRNGSIPIESGKAALNALESMGCNIDTRGNIHEKALIIDGSIVWFGSLNPLSHTAKTSEVMARIESTEVAQQLISFLSVNKVSQGKGIEDIFTAKENPQCPECNQRVAYMTGRYGSYWDCEECNWRQNTDRGTAAKKKSSTQTSETGPDCPKCGSPTHKRSGRYGSFYGCSNYPECNGTVKI